MKDSRPGEHLWDQWSGEGYIGPGVSELIFYTIGHVDLENEIVRRALASSLQREGVVDTLSDGFNALQSAEVLLGWAGLLNEEIYLTACDRSGETPYGDLIEDPLEVTWVEIFL